MIFHRFWLFQEIIHVYGRQTEVISLSTLRWQTVNREFSFNLLIQGSWTVLSHWDSTFKLKKIVLLPLCSCINQVLFPLIDIPNSVYIHVILLNNLMAHLVSKDSYRNWWRNKIVTLFRYWSCKKPRSNYFLWKQKNFSSDMFT